MSFFKNHLVFFEKEIYKMEWKISQFINEIHKKYPNLSVEELKDLWDLSNNSIEENTIPVTPPPSEIVQVTPPVEEVLPIPYPVEEVLPVTPLEEVLPVTPLEEVLPVTPLEEVIPMEKVVTTLQNEKKKNY